MIYHKPLATATLLAGLLTGVLGSSADEHPLTGLARRGIRSARLNELYFSGQNGESCHCALACEILATEFGGEQVSHPGEAAYGAAQARFWSRQQARARPRCFFRPRGAEEVSVAVLLARAAQCPFAVKGGGHAAFGGSSSSDGGITVDFLHMRRVAPSADRRTVSLGPGNTWLDVYSALEPEGLAVVGGRVASVGVGGLLLGGGISFFTGQHGWACDNVVNYEVVLASGEVVDANASSSPGRADLFWALRGGGGNFGVVTRFDVRAFAQRGPMWGGDVMYELAGSRAAVVAGVVRYARLEGARRDPKAHLIASFAYAQAYGLWVADVMLDHADPHPEGGHPAVFDDFFLADPPPLASTLRTNSLANLTVAVDATSPFGFRNSYWTLTTRVDADLMAGILDIFQEEVTPLVNVTAIVPAISFQVVTPSQRASMARDGGNALGLGGGGAGAEAEEPLLLFVASWMWALESDDELVLTAARNLVARSEALARERGLDHPYLYVNYASQFQDPYSGYGPENKKRLIEIAKKYDPTGVFQKLHPGYFKLEGAPAVWPF